MGSFANFERCVIPYGYSSLHGKPCNCQGRQLNLCALVCNEIGNLLTDVPYAYDICGSQKINIKSLGCSGTGSTLTKKLYCIPYAKQFSIITVMNFPRLKHSLADHI